MLPRPACFTAPSDVWTSSGAASSSPASMTARADSRLKTLNPPIAQPSRRARMRYSFGFTTIVASPRGLPSLGVDLGREGLGHYLVVPDDERVGAEGDVHEFRGRLPREVDDVALDRHLLHLELGPARRHELGDEPLEERPDGLQALERSLLREDDRLLGIVLQNLVHVARADRSSVMVEDFFRGHCSSLALKGVSAGSGRS